MKGNSHKKDYREDKFARRFYCDHARLNQLRSDKRTGTRKTRRKLNKIAMFSMCLMLILFLAACKISYRTQTIFLEDNYPSTVTLKSNDGYYFEFNDNNSTIEFTKDNQHIATGCWINSAYIEEYFEIFNERYNKIEAFEKWSIYENQEISTQCVAICEYNNEKFFFLINSNSVEHLINIAQSTKIK